MKLAVASEPGSCEECGCRYRPGELIITAEGVPFHSDCYRTRGAFDLRPYETEQPVELDLLLMVIRSEGVSSELPS